MNFLNLDEFTYKNYGNSLTKEQRHSAFGAWLSYMKKQGITKIEIQRK